MTYDLCVGVDARPLSAGCKRQGGGGIGTYLRSILTAWAARPPDAVRFSLLGEPAGLRAWPDLKAASLAAGGDLSGFAADHWRAPRRLADAGAAVAWYPSQLQAPLRQIIPTVITVHDLIPDRFPELYPADLKEKVRRWAMRHALRRATKLIAVSATTKREIVELLGIPEEKIAVICEAPRPEMASPVPEAELAALRRRYGLPARFALYLGGLDPRKPIAIARDGLARLPEPLPLVIVSANRSPVLERELAAAVPRPLVIGPVPDAELAGLYRLAHLFLYPTRAEGCGLPVLDALAAGVPVVASAVAALREMAGTTFVPVAEETPEAWARAVGEALVPARRDELVAAGKRAVATLSWDTAAAATLEVLRSAVRVGR